MSNTPKTYPYKTLQGLTTRLRSDLKDKNFVLLYAYNGTGKTRISMEFKECGKRKNDGSIDTLYFNAFTEDLFTWHNDFENDSERYLTLNTDSRFFNGFKDLALEPKITTYLERYASFDFKIDYEKWIITFSQDDNEGIKISRGEENIFIWCIFLAIIELTIDDSDSYNWVKYFYIDDPISSLDDNNAIAVASDLAKLLKTSSEGSIKTVISTHHSLFFNIISNELKKSNLKKYFLHRAKNSNDYVLQNTTETPFFYHVAILSELQQAVKSGKLYTYHFNMLRSILEKTAVFFGFKKFSDCIYDIEDKALHARALNVLSHGKYSIYEPVEMGEDNKELFKNVLNAFLKHHKFNIPKLTSKATTKDFLVVRQEGNRQPQNP
jgi:hypothetical protein